MHREKYFLAEIRRIRLGEAEVEQRSPNIAGMIIEYPSQGRFLVCAQIWPRRTGESKPRFSFLDNEWARHRPIIKLTLQSSSQDGIDHGCN